MAAVDINPEFQQELEADPATIDYLLSVAQQIEKEIVRVAPRGQTGKYKESIHAKVRQGQGAARVVVETTSFKWHWMEYGTAKMPAHRPFARGVEAAGMKFEAIGKGG